MNRSRFVIYRVLGPGHQGSRDQGTGEQGNQGTKEPRNHGTRMDLESSMTKENMIVESLQVIVFF